MMSPVTVGAYERLLRPLMRRLCLLASLAMLASQPSAGQESGAAGLSSLVRGLTVTARVLIIGARPEDADADLIAWLARGQVVQTAYMSLSRGEQGRNMLGPETGLLLGALRTEEALASRQHDGAEQYFTRAYDAGATRSVEDTYRVWNHDTLLGDIVTIIRAYRPHVIIASVLPGAASDGQQRAVAGLVREAFDAALDTVRYPAEHFGSPWRPTKAYEKGSGLRVTSRDYDALLGHTYAAIAFEARSEERSQGFPGLSRRGSDVIDLRRTTTITSEPASAAAEEHSLFDGLDTSWTRLRTGLSLSQTTTLNSFAAYADSARQFLDLTRPATVTHYLAHAAMLAASLRASIAWCRHPAVDAALPSNVTMRCKLRELDMDAAIDLMLRRANQALLLSAGVSVRATAEKELLAEGDTAIVDVAVSNFGEAPIAITGVYVSGAQDPPKGMLIIPKNSTAHIWRTAVSWPSSHPWWMNKRTHGFFEQSMSQLNGVRAKEILSQTWGIASVAIPEGIRRATDVTIALTIDSVDAVLSIGPVTSLIADPKVGVRWRPVSGVPAVTMAFESSLVWMAASSHETPSLTVTLRAFSDRPQALTLKAIIPSDLRLAGLPKAVTLLPHQQQALSLSVHGSPRAGRYVVGLVASGPSGDRISEGFFTVEYPHLAPLRIFRSSATWLQVVDVAIPPSLRVAYVRGEGDDTPTFLRQLGVSVVSLTPDELLGFDLSRVTTVVLGARMIEVHAELRAQMARLFEFVRHGGTVVSLYGTDATLLSLTLPFPIKLARPLPDQVTFPDSPVRVIEVNNHILSWPNAINANDWNAWVDRRAQFLPSSADSRYARPLEMHDPGSPDNSNAVLIASLGQGHFIYTSLSLPEQIANGVSGALRLLVNMLSSSTR